MNGMAEGTRRLASGELVAKSWLRHLAVGWLAPPPIDQDDAADDAGRPDDEEQAGGFAVKERPPENRQDGGDVEVDRDLDGVQFVERFEPEPVGQVEGR